ncbi:uncharacterized protein [Henckelia pumila]|uniref:uncharacterized protein isoform X2 n=1 Tax=Henckelia pumila TaxID=405737 RepID=UPI003C6DDBF1
MSKYGTAPDAHPIGSTSSAVVFRVMGEKLLSDLHKKCDDYMDPCLYEKCGVMESVYVGSFEWVSKYAILAMNIYNQKEQKNFNLIKVERLYMISNAYYCMTFWARNGKSDEYRLFRALVCFKGDAEEIFKGYIC